jgi:nucleoside-diphosphate-sugar epimerase
MIYIIGSKGYLGASLLDHFGDEAKGIGRADPIHEFGPNDTVINCAAYGWVPGQEDVEEAIRSNIELPMLLEKNRNGANLIYFASGMQRERPDTLYALTKNVTCRLLEGKAHIVTLYTIYGGKHEPKHRFMGTFLRACKHGTPYVITTPEATRDFVHIDRLSWLMDCLVGSKNYGNIDFGCGLARSLSDVYKHVLFNMLGCGPNNVRFQYPKRGKYPPYCAQSPYLADYFPDDMQKEWESIA